MSKNGFEKWELCQLYLKLIHKYIKMSRMR